MITEDGARTPTPLARTAPANGAVSNGGQADASNGGLKVETFYYSRFERDAFEKSVEGRIAHMAALACRMRDSMRGMKNNPRVQRLPLESRQQLDAAIAEAASIGSRLSGLMTDLFEDDIERLDDGGPRT
jgi:hypothetical protein